MIEFSIGNAVTVKNAAKAWRGRVIDKGIRGEFRGAWLVEATGAKLRGMRQWVWPDQMDKVS